MFNLPDLNVTGFESKAYIRYYTSILSFLVCSFEGAHHIYPQPQAASRKYFSKNNTIRLFFIFLVGCLFSEYLRVGVYLPFAVATSLVMRCKST